MRIKNTERLTDHGNKKMRADVVGILEAGMIAGDPYNNTRTLVQIKGNKLFVGGRDFEPDGTPRPGMVEMDLGTIDRFFVFGAGKGIQRAALALEDALGGHLTGGHIIVKYGDVADLKKIGVTYGAHPIPDQRCVDGCKEMVKKIKDAKLTDKDVVFTIVGNGVSSLLTLPAAGLSLQSVMDITRILQIEKGAPTRDLNAVRNSVDLLKGGRITRLLTPAKMFHILTIDCNRGMSAKQGYVGLTETNIWLHTLPDATNAEVAMKVLRRFDAWDEMSDEVKNFLQNMTSDQDSLKKDEFERMDCRIYGVMPDHLGALQAAFAEARKRGYTPHSLNKKAFDLDAAESGKFMSHMAKLVVSEDLPFKSPCALFMTGEKVVKVGKSKGIGGRNQEYCIAAANIIGGEDRIAIGSVDTDGNDGPGGDFDPEARKMGVIALAGGVVDGTSKAKAAELGYDLPKVVNSHDTSKPLWDMGDAVWAVYSISTQDMTVVLVSGK
jgi:glycerate-2-kinase